MSGLKTQHTDMLKEVGRLDSGGNTVAGGSGSGRKNYIKNPSMAGASSTNWTTANFTLSQETGTSAPRYTTTGSAFKLISTANSSTATFLSSAMRLDEVDKSKNMGIELAINLVDASNWKIDVLASTTISGTYTRLTLSTDSSGITYLPATTGIFKSTVDMVPSMQYIKFQITSVATAKTGYFSDIMITPDGNTIQGAVVEEWKSYTPTVINQGGTNPTGVIF